MLTVGIGTYTLHIYSNSKYRVRNNLLNIFLIIDMYGYLIWISIIIRFFLAAVQYYGT